MFAQLEQSVVKLKAMLEITSDDVDDCPPLFKRIRLLEQENARLRDEKSRLLRVLTTSSEHDHPLRTWAAADAPPRFGADSYSRGLVSTEQTPHIIWFTYDAAGSADASMHGQAPSLPLCSTSHCLTPENFTERAAEPVDTSMSCTAAETFSLGSRLATQSAVSTHTHRAMQPSS